ncbi:MAG: hypothetical protein R6U70_00840, partial [Bacillota bacterium]
GAELWVKVSWGEASHSSYLLRVTLLQTVVCPVELAVVAFADQPHVASAVPDPPVRRPATGAHAAVR